VEVRDLFKVQGERTVTTISPHTLHLPTRVGDVTNLLIARRDANIVGVCMEGAKLYLLIEASTEPDGYHHTKKVIVVPCDVSFDLPQTRRLVGCVTHPKHGPLIVYDVTGR
jgi:hypothetical protein